MVDRRHEVRRIGGHTPLLFDQSFLFHLREEKMKVRDQDHPAKQPWLCSCSKNNPSDCEQCLSCAGSRSETELLPAHVNGLCGGATFCRFCREEKGEDQ